MRLHFLPLFALGLLCAAQQENHNADVIKDMLAGSEGRIVYETRLQHVFIPSSTATHAPLSTAGAALLQPANQDRPHIVKTAKAIGHILHLPFAVTAKYVYPIVYLVAMGTTAWLLTLMRILLAPITYPLRWFVVAPMLWAYHFVANLQPLWMFISFAVFVGLTSGLCAGFSTDIISGIVSSILPQTSQHHVEAPQAKLTQDTTSPKHQHKGPWQDMRGSAAPPSLRSTRNLPSTQALQSSRSRDVSRSGGSLSNFSSLRSRASKAEAF